MTTPAPGQPLGMSDFFALEAGEYLERLDGVLQAPEGTSPAPEEFVRLSRALRGSALMANHPAIARAASGLESLARAVREGRRAWDTATRQIAIRAVDDLKIFVRRAASWTEADTAKAEALGSQLEQVGGRPSAQIRAAEALGLDAGARAFVAREGAAIASALDRASQALRANPLAHDPLQHVLRALQPLRGLAALNDLPPLPDLLEGIERAIGELGAARPSGPPPSGASELFQAAAAAIAKAAREVADRGKPDAEASEFRVFAERLVKLTEAETEPGVVPVGDLYFHDSGPHIVRRGTPPARPATLGRLELVSHGEHLRQAADSLERAPSATQRELRAHTLAGTFRALSSAGGGPLAESVAEFARAAREAVTGGAATRDPAGFAAELRHAGDLLTRSSSGDETELATDLHARTAAMRALSHAGGAALSLHATPAASTVAPPARSTPALQDDAPPETPDLIGSWATYRRMVATGIGPASLDELLAGAAQVPPRAPSPDTRRPAAPLSPQPATSEPGVVDIRTLLYRGPRAQQRAMELREEARRASGDQLRALVDEVCDLVALALEPIPVPPASGRDV
jgi:chemotaxis protein histidine kinase CheA